MNKTTASVESFELPQHYNLYGTAFVLLAGYYFYQVFTNCTFKVPGPWYTKWTSTVMNYKWLKGDRTAWVHELHKKYGPVVRVAPDEVSIVDSETVKILYARKETFRKSIFYKYFGSTAIPSLFSTRDPEYHRRHRKLLAGPMSETQLKKVIPRIQNRVAFALDRIEQEMDTRGAADMLKWWFFMATDIIGELSFGEGFHMLETGKASSRQECGVSAGN
ncbi:hypothetical protein PWT90_02365 [Aphanocladium album]|nr:hypothetical protein PWT90_02365 [Aphanocladium album]